MSKAVFKIAVAAAILLVGGAVKAEECPPEVRRCEPRIEVTGTRYHGPSFLSLLSRNYYLSRDGGSGGQEPIPLETVAQRTEPACLEEKLVMEGTKAAVEHALNEYRNGRGGALPGVPLDMTLRIPPYTSAAGWHNWAFQYIVKDANGLRLRRIEVHYLVNIVSQQSAGFKFKNMPEEACSGTAVHQ